MKKNFLMFAVVAAAFSLSACSNDDQENIVLAPEKENTVVTPNQENITVTPEGYKVTFTAGMGNGATSKTTIAGDDGLDIWFTKDDEMLIVDANGQEASDVTITLPDGKETSPTCTISATFANTPESPYKAYSHGWNVWKYNGNMDYWIEDVQSPAEGSFDPYCHMMMATTETDDYNFRFATKNSFFKFTAPCDLLGVTLTATKGEFISGEYYERPDGTFAIDEEWSKSSIKIKTPMETGKTYYISLIPNTFESGSLQLTLYPTYDTYMTYTVNKPFEAKVNKVHTFKSLTGLSVKNGYNWDLLGSYLSSPDCPDEPTIYLEGYDGSNFDNSALKNTSKKVHLELPEGLTTIPDRAFLYCRSIVSIKIPNSVTSIGESAFEECSGITTLTIPSNVESIGYRAFFYCTGITGVVEIPDGVTSIGGSAFNTCNNMTGLSIPNSVISFGNYAFSGCTKLADLSIDMETIPEDAFSFLRSITNVTFGPNVKTIGESAFEECSGITTLTIPSNVESIGHSAFYNCTGITGKVVIPYGVTEIWSKAFAGCTNMTGTSIPKSVTYLGSGFIERCTSLTDLSIDMETIPARTFLFINSITNVTFGPNVKTIGESAFEKCSGITTLTIPSNVESIGYRAFYNCSGITGEIVIPNGVTSIGGSAFYGCSNITGISIPNSVTELGDYCFYNCTKLKDVYINLENIRGSFFWGFSNITNMELGDNVKSIKSMAFYDCSGLTTLTIPNSVVSVEAGAFDGLSTCEIHVTKSLKAWYSEQYPNKEGIIAQLIDDVPEK